MTHMRALSSDMSAEAVAEVYARLEAIRREHGVHIPWAIESGSRAWGFPSPDSDYDGRFIYVRPARDALTVWSRRDVIETPLEGLMDVNGWDLSKAIRLILKGNAVAVEWLTSPMVYDGLSWFRDDLIAFADAWIPRPLVVAHYGGLAFNQRQRYMGEDEVELKKLFYALRPATALRWLRMHPERAVAPMHFPTLLAESDPPHAVAELTAEMIALKAVTREMGRGPLPAVLSDFIDGELAGVDKPLKSPGPMKARAAEAADELYRTVTLRLDAETPIG